VEEIDCENFDKKISLPEEVPEEEEEHIIIIIEKLSIRQSRIFSEKILS
jgi:hypothetical protein